ncbi:MAG: pentapeptide repeat-containing protein [Deltaproteobacteria bacterium]|nr:pentapeptide repeat-containing protein [Deltaproteobacteria bacterium]
MSGIDLSKLDLSEACLRNSKLYSTVPKNTSQKPDDNLPSSPVSVSPVENRWIGPRLPIGDHSSVSTPTTLNGDSEVANDDDTNLTQFAVSSRGGVYIVTTSPDSLLRGNCIEAQVNCSLINGQKFATSNSEYLSDLALRTQRDPLDESEENIRMSDPHPSKSNHEHLAISGYRSLMDGMERVVTKLNDTDLRGADLSGTDLSDADLRSSMLIEATLCGANLSGANLSGVDLNGVNLEGANLSCANLKGANLRGCNLRKTNLNGTRLDEANLSQADLRGADLASACLRKANLKGADLRGAKNWTPGQLRWAITNKKTKLPVKLNHFNNYDKKFK